MSGEKATVRVVCSAPFARPGPRLEANIEMDRGTAARDASGVGRGRPFTPVFAIAPRPGWIAARRWSSSAAAA